MKNSLYLVILVLGMFYACSNDEQSLINGMWQLKNIQNEHNTVFPIDTIYYSFQQEVLFSYTILHAKGANPPATVYYGYIDFPDKDHLHILMDKQYGDISMDYTILKLKSKEMILAKDGDTYHFIKF